MQACSYLYLMVAAVAGAQTDPAKQAETPEPKVPSWARDAFWYEVDVPLFFRADLVNDPAGTPASTPKAPPSTRAPGGAAMPGGDLKGLQAKLPYIKDLGVNALYVTSVFPKGVDDGLSALRHVSDAIGEAGSLAQVTGETDDPSTWRFSASDRSFLAMVEQAHAQGIRVAIAVDLPGGPAAGPEGDAPPNGLIAVMRRWMDPNADGNPADGIDGWIVGHVARQSRSFWRQWREQVKKINAEVLLIADPPDDPSPWLAGDTFDTAVNHAYAEVLARFFRPGNEDYTAEHLFKDLEAMQGRQSTVVTMAMLNPSAGADGERLIARLHRSPQGADAEGAGGRSGPPSKAVMDRWRLAALFHLCYIGAPMLRFGEETGMPQGGATAPMSWPDLTATSDDSKDFRLEMLALVQLMGRIHGGLTPLRQGYQRRLLWDHDRGLLAFSRLTPGDVVILVMNYGKKLEEAEIPAGKPRQLLGVLEPQLWPVVEQKKPATPNPRPSSPVPYLQLTGSRQFANDRGITSLWVPPGTVKLVLVNDHEPR